VRCLSPTVANRMQFFSLRPISTGYSTNSPNLPPIGRRRLSPHKWPIRAPHPTYKNFELAGIRPIPTHPL
jgi:hypothetical protein